MRRRAEFYDPDWQAYNVLKDVDPERLKLLGAIVLEWNYIEDMVDECLTVVLRVPFELRGDLSSRINGLEGKFELIKKGVRLYQILKQPEKDMIAATIGAVAQIKTYRDALVHIRLGDPASDIGLSHLRKGSAFEVLASVPALTSLMDHVDAVSQEIAAAYGVLEGFNYDEFELVPEGVVDPKK